MQEITRVGKNFYRGDELLASYEVEGDKVITSFTFDILDSDGEVTHPDALEIHYQVGQLTITK